MDDLKKFCAENQLLCAGLLVLVLVLLYNMYAAEQFTNRTVNMIAFRNPDPTLYKYTDRERDPSGMDLNDYYLENDMTMKLMLGPELHGDAAFQQRVMSEGTMLKDGVADQAPAEAVPGAEDFVGGMSY